jgi:long-subunit acyl-CoA synthetase (AMP-forming)
MNEDRREDAAREHEGKRGDREFGTIPGLVRTAHERHANRPAIEDGEVTLTYTTLAGEVERASRALIAVGVGKGDRVAVWAPNTWEWIVAALAAHAAGGVLVPINTRFKANEAGYVLVKSGARVLFTVSGFLSNDYAAMLRASDVVLPSLEHTILLRGAAAAGTMTWSDFMRRADLVSSSDARARASSVEPTDLSDIIFTSGTTGNPKGVMCTHAQSLRAFRDWAIPSGPRRGPVPCRAAVLPHLDTQGGWRRLRWGHHSSASRLRRLRLSRSEDV